MPKIQIKHKGTYRKGDMFGMLGHNINFSNPIEIDVDIVQFDIEGEGLESFDKDDIVGFWFTDDGKINWYKI